MRDEFRSRKSEENRKDSLRVVLRINVQITHSLYSLPLWGRCRRQPTDEAAKLALTSHAVIARARAPAAILPRRCAASVNICRFYRMTAYAVKIPRLRSWWQPKDVTVHLYFDFTNDISYPSGQLCSPLRCFILLLRLCTECSADIKQAEYWMLVSPECFFLPFRGWQIRRFVVQLLWFTINKA